jgi:hemoglobin
LLPLIEELQLRPAISCRARRRVRRAPSTAHAKLPITNAHFNALVEDLYIAFDRVGVSYALQNETIALLAPMQREIVKR